MKILSLSAMALAGIVAAGCPAPETRTGPRNQAPAWKDTGTPSNSVVTVDPAIRYYRDSTGALWNDRGKRVDGT